MGSILSRQHLSAFTVLSLIAGVVAVSASIAPAPAVAGAVVVEQPPNIPWGGRTVAVSINPEAVDHVLAATESGGVFVSFDAGATWDHVDGMPQHRMVDLRFHPRNGSIVLATATGDSRAGAGTGGIWRSTDGGSTWSRPATANVCPQHAAYGIAWERGGDGTVVIGSECGIEISRDSGGTWTHVNTTGGYEASVTADLVGSDLVIATCGDDGFQRSEDTGATWTSPVRQPNGPECFSSVWAHSLQTSPYTPEIIWAAFFETDAARTTFTGPALWESRDGGITWGVTRFETNRNRPPFVIVHESASGAADEVDVWYGNGVRTFLETCEGVTTGDVSTTGSVTCDGTTPQVTEDHADQIDIAYPAGSNCARFMASDGGVHRSDDCGGSFSIVGGNGNGFNALQIYDMALQAHPDHTDLYFGTQDNQLWASPDGGATWPGVVSAEGFFLDVAQLGDGSHSDSLVTGVQCAACNNFKTAQHFDSFSGWNDPVTGGGGNPYLIKPGWYGHVADADPTDADPTLSLYVNDNVDAPASWRRVLDFQDASGNAYNLQGRAEFVGPPGDPVMYQAYRDAANDDKLLRVTGVLTSATPTITEVTGMGDIAGYCNGQGTFVCPTVFGANPANPDELIVMDGGDAKAAVRSDDGGQTFVTDTALTAAITGNGEFRFSDEDGGGSQAHVIAWDPENTDRILVGTEQAGIVASYDGGTTWARVSGSEAIPAISDIEFDRVTGEIWISSYGRGLWTIELPEVDLSIGKTHRPEFPTAGREILYDVVVANGGPDAAADVVVTDRLPPQVSYVTTTLGVAGSGCAVTESGDGVTTGETVVCDVGQLAPGQTVTFTIRGFVARDAVSAAGGPVTVTNHVRVGTASATDLDPTNDEASDNAVIEDLADLEIAKVCDDAVHAGDTATCTITVDNEGPSDARGVVVTDELSSDGSFTVVSASSPDGTCSVSGATVTCDIGVLEASSTSTTGRATVVVEVSADEGQTIENLATVRSDTPDSDHTNDQAVDSISVTAVADLVLSSLTGTPDPVVAGEAVTWNLQARNDGPSTARNAIVSLTLPAGISITSISTADGGSCSTGTPGDPGDPAVCGLDDLAPADVDVVTVAALVDPARMGELAVSARISSETLDLDDSDDLASVVTAVTTVSDVSVGAFSATPEPVVAGTPLAYEARIAAAGPSVARDVVVRVAMPSAVDFATATVVASGGGTCAPVTASPDTLECALGDLAPGAAATIAIGVDVRASADPGVVHATATAVSGTPDPDATNDALTVATAVITEADMSLTLSAPLTYKPSTTVRYTVDVRNVGPSEARDGVVQIALPDASVGQYMGSDGPCTESGGTLTCTLAHVQPGGQMLFSFDFFIRGNRKRVEISGTLTATTPDPDTSDNSSTVAVDSR